MTSGKKNFDDTLSEAVDDFTRNGYDNSARLAYWQERIAAAARAALKPPEIVRNALNEALTKAYRKQIDGGLLLKRNPGVGQFTLAKVAPSLRAELDRRILASADLIRFNREDAIQKTLQRFAGWSTSIPAGGSEAVAKRQTTKEIGKALKQLPFAERRVLIDQGHKLAASINNIVAVDGGAIALTWHSHFRQAGYNYREDHKERDSKVYAIRGGWSFEDGLTKVGPAGWYDDITSVGSEPFCRCYASFIYNLRDLPSDMLTVKGRDALEAVRVDLSKK